MKKESGKTGRKTRRRKPIDGESKRIIRELILDILKDIPEEIPGFSLQSSENPLPLLCKSIKKNSKVMKATVESVLLNMESKSVEIFAEILNNITSSETEDELRYCMKILQERYPSLNRYFSFGFGSTHMWVCEPGSKFRLIFVEF
jgi:hypothetical protein